MKASANLSSDRTALLFTLWFCFLFYLGVRLSLSELWIWWGIGQVLLSWGFILAFVILHEAGHKTFFRSSWANLTVGFVMGFACGVPYFSWKYIHFLHHKWTGWRDVDPTTQVTLKTISPALARTLDWCWTLWLPIFSINYRIGTYWNLGLLKRELERKRFYYCCMNMLVYLVGIAGLIVWLTPHVFLSIFGFSFMLSMSLMDPMLLSQHSHIRMPLKAECAENIRPLSSKGQVVYTRSIIAPKWISLLVFLGFDRHELHHKYPQVPGYCLGEIAETFSRTYGYFDWISRAKKIKASVLIFSSEAETGIKI